MILIGVQDPELPATLSSMSGLRPVCLVYDAVAFDPLDKAGSAADPSYIAALEASGAEVQLMPKVEAVK